MAITFGTSIPPQVSPRAQVNMAVLLEKLGYDRVWWPDHLLFTEDEERAYDCWSVMAAAALRTSRIELGTAVSDVHRVHPAVFAQRVATLDQLCKGRLRVGLGSGEAMNLDPFGIPWKDRKIGRTREFIDVYQGLLKGPMSYEGSFYRLDRARLTCRTYKGRHVPMYLAAVGPMMQKLAGQRADGWLPCSLPASAWRDYYQPIADAAREAGRPPLEQVCTLILALTDREVPQGRLATALRPYAPVLAWPVAARRLGLEWDIPEHLEGVGYHSINPCAPETVDAYRLLGMTCPDEVVTRFFHAGNLEQLKRVVAAYVDAGVRHFMVMNASPDPIYSMLVLAHELFPHFTGRRPPLVTQVARNLARPLAALGLTRKVVPAEQDLWRKAGLESSAP